MTDKQELQKLQEEKNVRVRAMEAGIVVAILAIFFVAAVAMWYDGWFSNQLGVAAAPDNPAASQSAAAPAPPPPPSGTVGQAPQTPPPAQNGR